MESSFVVLSIGWYLATGTWVVRTIHNSFSALEVICYRLFGWYRQANVSGTMIGLTDLPEELTSHILSLIEAEDPPSKKFLHEEPSVSVLVSDHHPLKDLAQTCRLLHRLSWRALFSTMRVSIEDTDKLIDFSQKYNLRGHAQSMVLYSKDSIKETGGSAADATLDTASVWSKIQTLMDEIEPFSVTLVLSPAAFDHIVPYKLNLADAWAFRIPYQILHLEQDQKTRSEPSAEPLYDQKIFTLRPWINMTFNEGSSVPVYSNYEYFHKRTPSLVKNPRSAPKLGESIDRLTTLTLIAVFPISHNEIQEFLTYLPNLQHLRVRLAPSASNQILDQPRTLGTCQRSDLWTELQSFYSWLINQLMVMNIWTLNLEKLSILDYPTTGFRETINGDWMDQSLVDWHHDGQGHWVRDR